MDGLRLKLYMLYLLGAVVFVLFWMHYPVGVTVVYDDAEVTVAASGFWSWELSIVNGTVVFNCVEYSVPDEIGRLASGVVFDVRLYGLLSSIVLYAMWVVILHTAVEENFLYNEEEDSKPDESHERS